MKLDEVDMSTKNTLAAQYRQEGMAGIAGIDLPDSFQPTVTDLVFLNVEGMCEVYVGESATYQGRNRTWRQVGRNPPSPGRTRLVLTTRGDFFTGFSKMKDLIGEAGGNYTAAAHPLDVAIGPVTPIGSLSAAPPAQAAGQPASQPATPATPQDVDRPLPENAPTETPSAGANSVGGSRIGGRSQLRNLVEECRRNPKDYAGREDVLIALKTNMVRESKPGVVLIGKEGVGKTAIVEMMARDIAFNRNMPDALSGKPIYDLPLGVIVENTRCIGEMERQLRRMLDVPGRPIFFADEIHQISRQELKPLCDILKPALANGQIRLIGATTPSDWRKVEDNAFKRRFLEMTVEEPSPIETFRMLGERVQSLARHHRLTIDEGAIREAVILAARYIPMRQFPDKAIDVLDLACALQTTHSGNEPVSRPTGSASAGTRAEAKGV